MKVFDLFETNEWTNKEETIEHLFKVQAARCHEYWIYLAPFLENHRLELALNRDWIFRAKARSLLTSVLVPSDIWEHASNTANISELEMNKYQRIFNRMINSKTTFENAGGKYAKKL